MAEQNPPIFLQAGSHPAEDWRRAFYALAGNRPGILAAGDLAVTENGTPNMTVQVASGQAFVKGSEATYQAAYFCENRGAKSVTISAADATNPRRDLIVARVRDAAYSGATNAWALEAVTGTPAASPSDPTVPANCLVLARVAVSAGVTSITNAAITDLRTTYSGQGAQASALGGVIVAATTMPSAPYEGMVVYDKDLNQLKAYDGTNWQFPGALGELGKATRTSNTSTFTSVVYPNSVTVTAQPNRKLRVHVHANVQAAGAGVGTSIGIANGAGTILNQAYRYQPTATVADQISVDYYATSGAGGSLTYQISAFAGGSGAIIVASSTSATYLAVYDEGPA